MKKIAVVTPYYTEPDETLLQCHRSVLGQTLPATHILVADGHPKPQLFQSAPQTLHITLPLANGDYGNTPRCIGAMLADSYGFDAVAFLDADNWFEPDHLATMMAAYDIANSPLVACKRIFRHVDGNQLAIRESGEETLTDVDTNCWLIFRPAFCLFRVWRIPKPCCVIGDAVFLAAARFADFQITHSDSRTVNYRTRWLAHYHAAGVAAPLDHKDNSAILEARAYLKLPEVMHAVRTDFGFYPNLG